MSCSIKKDLTPISAAKISADMVDLTLLSSTPYILDPTAGRGVLLSAFNDRVKKYSDITPIFMACEKYQDRLEDCGSRFNTITLGNDFYQLVKDNKISADVILCNFPFKDNECIEMTKLAYKHLLNPGGQMILITNPIFIREGNSIGGAERSFYNWLIRRKNKEKDIHYLESKDIVSDLDGEETCGSDLIIISLIR